MSEGPVHDLTSMLKELRPTLDQTPYRFIVEARDAPAGDTAHQAFAIIREAEGVTYICPVLDMNGAEYARITLQVHSDLAGVGLTAAIASALAQDGIACNMIAGFYHDHVFVPWAHRNRAIAILQGLSQDAGR
ncbi:MAG: ACT domain-containing protein [Pseudomonadota bacterium]